MEHTDDEMAEHIKYMKRAIELSKKGIGYTNPNPLVGAVIVKDGKIIGEGYHEKIGHNHAEINALGSCNADVSGGTMYVTLEPCSHYGKTPPCANAIVKSKISKVVIGMIDPNPQVAGNGIKILEENNIEVISGVCEEEIRELNRIFIKYITTKKPYCILKSAMTLDGKIASITGDSKWISNDESRKYVHEIRHRVSAIMVGIGTVLIDNPRLTTRLENKEVMNPIKVIVDSTCRISVESNVIRGEGHTIVATTEDAPSDKVEQLIKHGVTVIKVAKKNSRVDLRELVNKLGKMGIDSILLEGGSSLNYSALESDIVDEVITFIAPKIIGGKEAKTPIGGSGVAYIKDAFRINDIRIETFGTDIMIRGYL